MTDIRHDFGDDGWKWYRGALAPTSIIYCPPGNSSHHGMILNIDMNTNMATELDVNLLPAEQGVGWAGNHVLLLLTDAFTSCIKMLVE